MYIGLVPWLDLVTFVGAANALALRLLFQRSCPRSGLRIALCKSNADLNPTLGFACHLLCTTGTPSAKPIASLLGRQLQKEAFKGRTMRALSPMSLVSRKSRLEMVLSNLHFAGSRACWSLPSLCDRFDCLRRRILSGRSS